MASTMRQAEGVPVRERRPGYEVVATRIVDHIRAADLKPGDRLPTERALGEQLGVSRTAVREAIKVLTATGLVRARQGSGLYVAAEPLPFATAAIDFSMPVDPEHMLSLFEYRCTIEMQAARLAAERVTPRELRAIEEALLAYRRDVAENLVHLHSSRQNGEQPNPDRDFHRRVAEGTHNQFFVTTVNTLHRFQAHAINLVLTRTPGSFVIAAEQHTAIFEAIQQGQPQEAAQAMENHIQTVRLSYQQELRRLLSGVPDGSIPGVGDPVGRVG